MGEEKPWKDEKRLRTLYHDEGLTLREIADRFGCHNTTVLTWMKKFGIERTPWRVDYASYYIDEGGYERWQSRYGDEKDTCLVHQLLAIAEGNDPDLVFSSDYHVHHENGVPWDNRPNNIELLTHSEHSEIHRDAKFKNSPWRDESTLKKLYVTEGMSLRQVSEELGCNVSTLLEWMDKFDIERRDHTDRYEGAPWRDEERLRRMYFEEGMSTIEIAERFGCESGTVWLWMEKFGIERRSLEDASEIRWHG